MRQKWAGAGGVAGQGKLAQTRVDGHGRRSRKGAWILRLVENSICICWWVGRDGVIVPFPTIFNCGHRPEAAVVVVGVWGKNNKAPTRMRAMAFHHPSTHTIPPKRHLYSCPPNSPRVIVVCDPKGRLVPRSSRELEELCSRSWAGARGCARALVTCSPVVCGCVRRPLPERGQENEALPSWKRGSLPPPVHWS